MAPAVGAGSGDPLVAELRRSGLVTLLVLHYVAVEPCYGNQLMHRIGSLTAGAVAVNPNTMYPLLRSLEKRGLISCGRLRPGPRGKRYYTITPQGETERRRLVGHLAPSLDAIASTIDVIRHELLDI
jgi:PadR family transcriptional regulator, regulatory protein PadR